MIKKNIYFLLGIGLISQICGCNNVVTYDDASNLQSNKQMIGKQYILLKDCYLIQLSSEEEFNSESKRNSNVSIWPCGTDVLPKRLEENKIGKVIKGIRIVGIAPRNSKFSLLKIIKMNMDSHVHFSVLIPIIKLSSHNNIDADALVDTTKSNFAFDKNLVKPVEKLLRAEPELKK